jgi:hypothetical protein
MATSGSKPTRLTAGTLFEDPGEMPPVIMFDLAGQEFREAGGMFDLAVGVNAGVQKLPGYLWGRQGGVGTIAIGH